MKNSLRIVFVFAGLAVLFAAMQFSSSRYDWASPFGISSFADTPPTYSIVGADPTCAPECGDDTLNVGSDGGYGIPTNLEDHAIGATAIVEGTARVSGPARFSGIEYLSRTRMNEATGINTPFTIKVTKTYKGPEKPEWSVSEYGGQVGCVNFQMSPDALRVFDGAVGLFFISAAAEFNGDWVRMSIVENGPEWFVFTEDNLGPIVEAVELIKTFD